VFGYVVILGIFWSPQRTIFLKLLSLPVWLAVLCHIATIVGPLRVPLVLLGIALVASGFISELGELKTSLKDSKCQYAFEQFHVKSIKFPKLYSSLSLL